MTTTTPESETEKAGESPAEQENESFGTWLRRQRELREISLREIADTSKISLRYLEALEDDRFDILPAPVFAKGFLRQYARYVGLDPEEAVNFYMTANGHAPDDREGDDATRHNAGSTPWSYAIIVFVIALVLMAVVWTLIWFNQRAAEFPDGAPTSSSSNLSTRDPSPPPPPPPPLPELRPEEAEEALPQVPTSFFITLDFRGDCWVRATVDGQVRADRVYTQGESLPLQASRAVDLALGNFREVEMEVEGQRIDLEDNSDNPIRRLHIDLDTVASLRQGGSLMDQEDQEAEIDPAVTNQGAMNQGAMR